MALRCVSAAAVTMATNSPVAIHSPRRTLPGTRVQGEEWSCRPWRAHSCSLTTPQPAWGEGWRPRSRDHLPHQGREQAPGMVPLQVFPPRGSVAITLKPSGTLGRQDSPVLHVLRGEEGHHFQPRGRRGLRGAGSVVRTVYSFSKGSVTPRAGGLRDMQEADIWVIFFQLILAFEMFFFK